MKRFVLILIALGTLSALMNCSKKSAGYFACKDAPISADTAALTQFARVNGLSVTQDSSGLYYEIITTGYGAYPTLNSKIFVTYTGTLLDGTVFDSTTNAAKTGFVLNTLMKAWQIGIPKIKVGGRIKLLVPSALGYGCAGLGTLVAPNTPIYYDASLDSIQ